MKALVEISTEVGKARAVFDSVKKIENVKEAYLVTGHCDIVALVEAEDLKAIGDIILEKIHRIEGVVDTETLICVE